jgi:hypothetical protein
VKFKKAINNLIQFLKNSYSLDLRALACMRIGIALIILIDLIIRSLSIKAFFTDEGILPLSILKLYNWNEMYFSFHALNGELWWQIILFILNAVCAFVLLIGYRTRVFTFICWVFLVSLQNRNPFILQGGDDLLRLALLWGIFLPWGERYSIKKESRYSNKYFSIANIGYMLLVFSVYFFSALLKTSPEWRTEGTALYYALSLDQIRLPFGTFLYQFPNLLKVLTLIVYYIELIAPLLFLLPFPKNIRLFGVICIALLHLGISINIYVGLFFIIGLVTLVGLLPSVVMDWLELKFIKPRAIKIIETNHQKPNFIFEFIFSLKTIFLSFVLFYCLMLNLGALKSFPYNLNISLIKFGNMFRLEQNWGMFSPYILKDDGYYVFSGLAKNNSKIDIKHNLNTVSFAKPFPVVEEFESDRWRKYSENYVFNNNNYMRPYYCKYLLKKWNAENPTNQISELTIYFMKEITLPDYNTKPIEKNVVCNCNITEIK